MVKMKLLKCKSFFVSNVFRESDGIIYQGDEKDIYVTLVSAFVNLHVFKLTNVNNDFDFEYDPTELCYSIPQPQNGFTDNTNCATSELE